MSVGRRMRELRKALKLDVQEVAQHLGVSRASIYRYENGDIEKFPIALIEPLAEILKTTPDYLMGWGETKPSATDKIQGIYNRLEPPRQEKVYQFAEDQLEDQLEERNKVLEKPSRYLITGRATAAGSALYVDDADARHEVVSESVVPKGADEQVAVSGDSMEPLIKDGDKVYIKHQPVVECGEIAIVRIESEGVTCKKVYVGGPTVTLRSINDKYEDMHYHASQITIIGKVLI